MTTARGVLSVSSLGDPDRRTAPAPSGAWADRVILGPEAGRADATGSTLRAVRCRADELQPGDIVLGADWRELVVGTVRVVRGPPVPAYNLAVDDIHTYHVGNNDILVHNTCPLETAARIQQHVAKSVDDFDKGLIQMSSAQQKLPAAGRGSVIDSAVKESVSADPRLQHLLVTRQGQYGPDFVDLSRPNTWYDVTTPGSWAAHLRRYGHLGDGVGIFTK